MAAEGNQYERAWLLLADIYIQSGKFDLAQVWLTHDEPGFATGCALKLVTLELPTWKPYITQESC